MKTEWFKGLQPPEVEAMKKSVFGSKIVLDKLIEICYNRSQALKSVRESDYDSPSWAFKQAHKNGYTQALDDLVEILTLKE
jgi:hypothetical protein